jgi:hypothetical protein
MVRGFTGWSRYQHEVIRLSDTHPWSEVSLDGLDTNGYLDHPVKPLTMGVSDPYHFTLVSRPPSESPDHGWV